jgi:hypothetical protein
MIEVTGDFFTYAKEHQPDVLVCTINQIVKSDGRLVMGAGIAKPFRDTFVDLDKEWGELTRFKKSGILVSWNYAPVVLVGFPTKYDWKDPSDKRLIKRSLNQLADFVDYYGMKSVLMTRPGCGHGGFKWPEIKPLFKGFDDRWIIISDK